MILKTVLVGPCSNQAGGPVEARVEEKTIPSLIGNFLFDPTNTFLSTLPFPILSQKASNRLLTKQGRLFSLTEPPFAPISPPFGFPFLSKTAPPIDGEKVGRAV